MSPTSKLRRIVLVRHGDTVDDSKHRFHGSSDVALSDAGRAQVRDASRGLRNEVFDIVVASPLRRSWQSAAIMAGGAPVRLENGFREIHFGRWEGMTKEEIEAADPVLFKDWQGKKNGFEFPSGELRQVFRNRVLEGLARIETSGAANALVVVHKGVIRTIAERLLGEPLADGAPDLGGMISLTNAGGRWFLGKRGSDPAGLNEAA